MTYTKRIVETAVSTFVPLGDELVKTGNELLKINYVETPKAKASKRSLNAKMATAKSIDKAVKEGKLNPKFEQVAEKMHTEARIELAQQNYTNKQYVFGQIKKAAPLLDLAIPGSGTLTTTAVDAVTAKNIKEYAQESADLRSTAIKTAQFVTPFIMGASSTLWMPFVSPWLGLASVGAAAAAVVGGAIIVDTVNYIRGQ